MSKIEEIVESKDNIEVPCSDGCSDHILAMDLLQRSDNNHQFFEINGLIVADGEKMGSWFISLSIEKARELAEWILSHCPEGKKNE